MTRYGEPIQLVGVKGAIDPHIDYSTSFGEWEAANAAGLDLWRWEQNEYPQWFKVRVLAWHKLHGLVELHKQDAIARSLDRKKK